MKKFQRTKFYTIGIVITGVLSLIWFLVRVIPKPTRATYPCQRAAFPLASAFVIWLVSLVSSITIFKQARVFFRNAQPQIAKAALASALLLFAVSFFVKPLSEGLANITAEQFDPDLVEKVEMKEITPPVIDSLMAKVSVVKSSRSIADNITDSELETMIRNAVSDAGGLDGIIKDGDYVVLKPNMVGFSAQTLTEFYGHITHFQTIEIVAKIVRELNPNGTIEVLENSYSITSDNFESMGYSNMKYIDGYSAIDEISGGWQEYTSNKLQAVSLHDTISLFPDNKKPNKARPIYLNKKYYNADVIISLPVMKNHRSAGITGAVKNVSIGCAPGNIYGADGGTKTNDRSVGIDHDDATTNLLHWWIHDFYMCRKVDFAIMDAIEGMDYGPGGGPNYQKNMRMILASSDAVAIDAIQGLLMQHDPFKVNYLVHLHNHHAGIADPALIEVVGADIPSNRTLFEHNANRPQALYSRFTKTTISNYSAIAHNSPLEDAIILDVNNVDEYLARITVQFEGDTIKRYIVDEFENVRFPYFDLDYSSERLKVIFEDKYLNRKEQTIDVTFIGSITNRTLAKINVYPNPAADYLHIELGTSTPDLQIRIYNMSGALVQNEPYVAGQLLDISSLLTGNYTLQLIKGNQLVAVSQFGKQ